jgi:hypothetical protein
VRENAAGGDPVIETALDLLRWALTAKLAAELCRPHAATNAAQEAGRLAARLVEELADARARGSDQQLGGDDEDDLELGDDLELQELRYPPAPDGGDDQRDDEPAGPT